MILTAINKQTGRMETRDIDPATDVGPRMWKGQAWWWTEEEEIAIKAEWSANAIKQAEKEAADATKVAEKEALIEKLEKNEATQEETNALLVKMLRGER